METRMLTLAVHFRLGLAVETNGGTCHHKNVIGRICGHELQGNGCHSLTCPVGGRKKHHATP
eukprot:3716229-Amphidinium_carterae.1